MELLSSDAALLAEHMNELQKLVALSCAACLVGSHRCTPVDHEAVPGPARKWTTMASYADFKSASALCKPVLPLGQAEENRAKKSPKSTADLLGLPLESLPSSTPTNRTTLVVARPRALATEPSLAINAEVNISKNVFSFCSSVVYLLRSSKANVLGL